MNAGATPPLNLRRNRPAGTGTPDLSLQNPGSSPGALGPTGNNALGGLLLRSVNLS